jgi:hypothetical protein
MGGTNAFRFSLTDSFRRDVASEIFQACDVIEVNGSDFRMAATFRDSGLVKGPFPPLHDSEMKQLMNAAKTFSLIGENVRKRFSVKDRSQRRGTNGRAAQMTGSAQCSNLAISLRIGVALSRPRH